MNYRSHINIISLFIHKSSNHINFLFYSDFSKFPQNYRIFFWRNSQIFLFFSKLKSNDSTTWCVAASNIKTILNNSFSTTDVFIEYDLFFRVEQCRVVIGLFECCLYEETSQFTSKVIYTVLLI